MQTRLEEAADILRAHLVRDTAGPEVVRAMLATIPPHDREAWLDLVWDIDELPDDDPHLPRGCVPYLPCPVATVLDALEQAKVSRDDVFVDVGAGMGRTALLAHLITGAGCIGLEIQPGLVQAARGRADWLKRERIRFVEGDAADLVGFMTIGTVFFFYCPFGRDRLDRALDELEDIARTREIRICCVGLPALDRTWLSAVPARSVDVAVYRSTIHPRPRAHASS